MIVKSNYVLTCLDNIERDKVWQFNLKRLFKQMIYYNDILLNRIKISSRDFALRKFDPYRVSRRQPP